MLELAVRGNNSAPAELPRTLRIVATDYACVVLLPPLVKRLAKSTPNLELPHIILPLIEENKSEADRRRSKAKAGPPAVMFDHFMVANRETAY